MGEGSSCLGPGELWDGSQSQPAMSVAGKGEELSGGLARSFIQDGSQSGPAAAASALKLGLKQAMQERSAQDTELC